LESIKVIRLRRDGRQSIGEFTKGWYRKKKRRGTQIFFKLDQMLQCLKRERE